jgi:hypothetical protein
VTTVNGDSFTELFGRRGSVGKTKMGPMTLMYPMPTALVGAEVDGKPNFMAVTWCGIANKAFSVGLEMER